MNLINDQIDRARERDTTSDVGAVSVPYIAADLQRLIVPIASLRSAPDNARKHAAADLDALTDSFRTYGQVRPFLGKRSYRGLRDVVLCGNGGLVVARRLNWAFVAVAWLPETTTDDDARRLAVLDNRLSELSSWDSTALLRLQSDGLDLLSLWHDDAALADVLRENAPPPRFQPEEEHRHQLDRLTDNVECPSCGYRWHQGARS